MIIKCKSCPVSFEANFHNTLYCPECASYRRIASDKAAWLRRKRRQAQKKEEAERPLRKKIAALEKDKQVKLGVSDFYFRIWKEVNPGAYKAWLAEALKATDGQDGL